MKKSKKILSLLLVVSLVFSIGSASFASSSTSNMTATNTTATVQETSDTPFIYVSNINGMVGSRMIACNAAGLVVIEDYMKIFGAGAALGTALAIYLGLAVPEVILLGAIFAACGAYIYYNLKLQIDQGAIMAYIFF